MKAMKASATRIGSSLRSAFLHSLLVALVIFCGATYSHASTVTLTLQNVSPGYSDGSYYTYPYNFSINGSSLLTALLCDDFIDDVYIGESWTANVWDINTIAANGQMTPVAGSLAFGQTKKKAYLEAAYLYNYLLSNLNLNNSVEVNHTVWALFSAVPSYNADAQVAALFAQANANTNMTDAEAAIAFGNIAFYTPIAGTQTLNGSPVTSGPHDGLPQEFIGRVTTPPIPQVAEPSSVALLGIGVLGLGQLARRKRRQRDA